MYFGIVSISSLSAFFHPCARSCFPCQQGQNVTFLKEIEDNKNRPGTKIYLERQKNEEVVCSPAEQGDAESWVVFCPEARAAC